jgi:hydrogenase maturation protein HypF
VVQGVGFRPFAAKLAETMGVKGGIRNVGGLVEVTVTGTDDDIEEFLRRLAADLPKPGEITHYSRQVANSTEKYDGFSILRSEDEETEAAALPADVAICDDCLRELRDPRDPRHAHPFISCMSCGPRYTIIERLPYDRENTAMEDFFLCGFCGGEYEDIKNRRYHAQTVSCHECGPMLDWVSRDESGRAGVSAPSQSIQSAFAARERALALIGKAAAVVLDDGIIALKGVGGYYFVCSPFSYRAVEKLRAIKIREEKPFAVMFPDVTRARGYCVVSDTEESLLNSLARPITLLERRNECLSGPPISQNVYKSSRYLGAFLPSFGAQYLLMDHVGPLVMTSANISDMPIVKDDYEILEIFRGQPLLGGVLRHDRRILSRLDDSVVAVTDGRPQMIRRSKGYVPTPIHLRAERNEAGRAATVRASEAGDVTALGRGEAAAHGNFCVNSREASIFAAGGQLKSAFTLTKGGLAYVSPYFGDLETLESEEVYLEGLERMARLFHVIPEVVACDLHPNYSSTRIAEAYASRRGLPLLRIQHHHAHVASVMAEMGLSEPVIGVAFDGTGYGTDGNIWGGEFLLCHDHAFERMAHLKYVSMTGGDSAMKEGWKTALCYVRSQSEPNEGNGAERSESVEIDISEIIAYSIMEGFREKALSAYGGEEGVKGLEAALSAGVNVVSVSSAGRIFDAVSSLLGICHYNRYEGECAIMLENAAALAMKRPGESRAWDLALKFHLDMSAVVFSVCQKIRESTGVSSVALCGGVFQNRILMAECLRLLRAGGFAAHYNVAVPPNDGGLSLGQAYLAERLTGVRSGVFRGGDARAGLTGGME